MSFPLPHTIENGAGEELTFVRFVDNDQGGLLEVENKVQPGSGPPMHIHWLQDETLTVVQGKLGAQVEGQPATFHGVGETITFKRGVAHRFWNAGEDVLLCKGYVSPANNIVYFLTEIYRSVKSNGGHKPSLFDGAFLQSRYQTEFDLVEIPTFVKKVLFPIIIKLGRLTGKYKKYEDAPEPVAAG